LDQATGAVLLQQGADGKWRPVAFYSKSLNDVQRNYVIHDKEMLAIVRALEEWWHFLEGAQHPVEIWMDQELGVLLEVPEAEPAAGQVVPVPVPV
jgi:hypothetical protein